MSRIMSVAALQCAFSDDIDANIATVSALVREAAGQGTKIILPPELFEGHYFCQHQDAAYFARAMPAHAHKAVRVMQALAAELGVYIPCSFFEKDGPHYYNSLAMIDDTGAVMGVYRKTHIPDGPGYSEKFYFRPGNTGFKVWDTRYGRIGVGICWDQWYPETARTLMLMGAEILMFPTAIGDEPAAEDLDTSRLWRRAMVGHAVSNVVPVIAANRIGAEVVGGTTQSYYGHSFIIDERGDLQASFSTNESGVLTARFDLDAIQEHRAAFGFFRDRRPDQYQRLVEDL
jgi:N-carbamoylputrescine amidase